MEENIKFAHLADLHLGAWREKKLTKLNFITFKLSIKKIIEEKVDFVLFAGDIFNTAMPNIELVEMVTIELLKLKKYNIPIYVIGGSHDYSNSGKSFITLLEIMGLFKDVSKYEFIDSSQVNLKFFKDKSNTIISGILGKKNGLDKNIYKNLNNKTLDKNYFNIFMFHCTLNDFKPDFLKNVNSQIKSNFLPKGFDYYAGGHIHTHLEGKYDDKVISYPGPLFPNNFTELIREKPSFNLCDFDFKTRKTKIKRIFLNTYKKEYLKLEFENLTPIQASNKIIEEIQKIDVKDKIILIELIGSINGKINDIGINKIISKIYDKGAYAILKNSYKLKNLNFEIKDIKIDKSISEIENEIITQNLDPQNYTKEDIELTQNLLKLNLTKLEEEKNQEFETRIKQIFRKALN